MKLKIKLPLLFLLMFILIISIGTLYICTYIARARTDWLEILIAPVHFKILVLVVVLTAVIFAALTLYFHFNITKPIQLLNNRLKSITVGHSVLLIKSKRKDEIGELYSHFNEAVERLQQAHKEQIDMIAAITHDIKTPLTTINGYMELLTIQKNLTDKEREEYYQLITRKSKHIEELVNSFSAFTRNELELDEINLKPVEAVTFFENIAFEYETELSGLDYQLEWKHSFYKGQCIMINEYMLRRVFGNLFSNSVRYGEKKDLKIYMKGYIHNMCAHFTVEDNGIGVPDRDIPSLFHKFFTVDKARQSKNGGNGLGLASCKSIIEHHGGQIKAFHSDYGGLGISFSLPLKN
ncbi:MAG: HAMP domain-containing sensor histidine kinase [Bacillota bacterium]|nr:HAMP domain-containing sensor histidine kinase [Bacillota bacterium]